MKQVVVYIKTNKVGSQCEDEFEVEDDASEEEITETAKEVAFQLITWDWHFKES